MTKAQDRTCYTCKHFRLCFLRRRVDDALTEGGGMLNIDDKLAAPKGYTDLFNTLAKMCLAYKFKEET